jgi:hypothetical protein
MAKLLSGCVLLVLSVSQAADLVTFHKLGENECIEATLDLKDVEQQHARSFVEASLASLEMQEGSCSSSGFTTADGESMPLQVPFMSKPLRLTRMRMSSWTAAKLKAEAFLASFMSSPAFRNSERQVVRAPKPIAVTQNKNLADQLKETFGSTTVHKVAKNVCSEMLVQVHEKNAAMNCGYTDGACEVEDYTAPLVVAETQSPFFSDPIKISMYTKSITGRRLDAGDAAVSAKIDKLASEVKGLIDKKVDDTAGAALAGSSGGAPGAAAASGGGDGVDGLVKDLKDQAAKLTEEIKAECTKR